ncbi:MAG TPA: S9 family peptidase [Cyclobacteriaceae bacterium]|nr:S9 family peptidase [Cyclobacteriaceae bacterium]
MAITKTTGILLSFILISLNAIAQVPITIDDLTATKDTFRQRTVTGIRWANDGKFYTSIEGNKIVKYDVSTGQAVATVFDGSFKVDDYSTSDDETKLLVATEKESIYRRSWKGDYYLYDIATKATRKLSNGGKQSYATFSSDGSKVAFVRDNNLFIVNAGDLAEQQITTDGKFNHIINGSTDWVYEEELTFAQAFSWSPDGKKIAWYRFDESGVKEYNLQKWNKGALYPTDYRYKYPKAGEDNSVVEIWIYDLATAKKVKADTGTEKDIYIPRVMWTNDANLLSVRRMNRLQNTLEILHVDATTGQSKVILTEKSDTYYDIDYTDELKYLKNGKQFMMASERSGYKHFYLCNMDGTALTPVTSGSWEATQLVGLDEKSKTLYYLSTEGNYLNRTFYSITLDGKKKTKLSQKDGSRSVNMSDDAQFYIDQVSNATDPLTVSLYKTKGNSLVKVIESNDDLRKKAVDYKIAPKEFFQYTAADGSTKVDGYIMKPATANDGKKYPVLVFQYSGPRSNSVSNSFGGGANFFWHQMLLQKGIAVAVVDTRGTGSRGEKFTKQTYKQMGKIEMEDLVAAGNYLGALPYIDKSRMGIWGWSYGGYTTALVMTKGAGTYKLGICGAPVTTWRYYDNIYTERFLQRPSDNPSGYDDNSPMTYASKLQGKFLLIHGTGDDNVHFQNSVALEDALISAGKQFRSFYYPDQAHGFRGAGVNAHRFALMTEFLLENL